MPRLCDRAYEILAAEVRRLCQNPLEKVNADIVLRRLHRLRQAEGPPVTLAELREAITDLFPNFSEKVLQRAVKANKAAAVQGRLGCLGLSAAGLVALVGGIWVLNLPFPMIRWPVARVAPIVLLPSYITMDRDYRQAISLVEQADQLVNNATSAQDINLGAEKVTQAQKHLDGLPVWFLGYYPQMYCSFVTCRWNFTFDEFESARKAVGRMEAIVFQEQNALTLLASGTAEVDGARQTYQTAEAGAQKQAAIATWQAGMDKLNEIPPQTLAGRMAATKLQAYQRDYAEITGDLSGGNRTNTLISAAQSFATLAAQESQNPPHPAATWERIAGLWQDAITRLQQVPLEDAGYNDAQNLLAQYTNNLGIINERLQAEQASVQALDQARNKTNQMLAQNLDTLPPNQLASQLNAIVNDLRKVQAGTTAYDEAQAMLQSAEDKLRQLNP